MAGVHAAPKPSPYSIAAGAVSYALAITFAKHIPADVIASAPAAVAVAVGAVERGVSDAVKVDPKLAPVAAKVDRLAEQAKAAADDVAQGVASASSVDAEVKPVV